MDCGYGDAGFVRKEGGDDETKLISLFFQKRMLVFRGYSVHGGEIAGNGEG